MFNMVNTIGECTPDTIPIVFTDGNFDTVYNVIGYVDSIPGTYTGDIGLLMPVTEYDFMSESNTGIGYIINKIPEFYMLKSINGTSLTETVESYDAHDIIRDYFDARDNSVRGLSGNNTIMITVKTKLGGTYQINAIAYSDPAETGSEFHQIEEDDVVITYVIPPTRKEYKQFDPDRIESIRYNDSDWFNFDSTEERHLFYNNIQTELTLGRI